MRSAGPLGHAETVYTVLMRYHVQPVSDTFHGRDIFSRDKGATRAEEAHLHAYVLGLVTLVYKEVVDLADLLARLVVDLVSGEAVLDRHEPVAALFVLRHANLLVCASQTTHRRHRRHAAWESPYPLERGLQGWQGVLAHI